MPKSPRQTRSRVTPKLRRSRQASQKPISQKPISLKLTGRRVMRQPRLKRRSKRPRRSRSFGKHHREDKAAPRGDRRGDDGREEGSGGDRRGHRGSQASSEGEGTGPCRQEEREGGNRGPNRRLRSLQRACGSARRGQLRDRLRGANP